MPKLLQINVVSNMLSTGKITEDISKVASSKGWECYVAYGRWARPGICKEVRIGSMFDVYAHYLEHKLLDNEGLSSRQSTKRFIMDIEELKPDIIHLHNIHDHYLNYPLFFDYLAHSGIPVVWTQHDCWSFTGGCMYYDMLDCEKWKNECTGCPEKRAWICEKTNTQFALKKEYFLKVPNLTLITVSNWLQDIIRESFFSKCDIRTIHNGVDLDVFRYGHSQKKDPGIFQILGVAGVWHKRKGLTDFIKIRQLLPLDYRIVLVGLSDSQIAELPEGIVGIRRTHDVYELASLYADSDVYVNPTYSDNFPTTNIESLACGTPVITYRTGGSPEAIDEVTGMVVEQGDVEALAESIRHMRLNPLSPDNCRKRAEQMFDKNICFDEYIELYNHILGNQGNGKN